jgi:hypothetical protein
MKKIVIICFISILIIFNVVQYVNCNSLKNEIVSLKNENTLIDSIKIENDVLEKNIKFLSDQTIKYEHKIDSLKKIKQRVVIKYKYVVSDNLTESVEILKDNLKCEKYY